jgi:hypothetical protein
VIHTEPETTESPGGSSSPHHKGSSHKAGNYTIPLVPLIVASMGSFRIFQLLILIILSTRHVRPPSKGHTKWGTIRGTRLRVHYTHVRVTRASRMSDHFRIYIRVTVHGFESSRSLQVPVATCTCTSLSMMVTAWRQVPCHDLSVSPFTGLAPRLSDPSYR